MANKDYVSPIVLHPLGIEIATGASKVFKFPYKEYVGILDVTESTGTVETLDVTFEEFDPASGTFFEIDAFTQAPADDTYERVLLNADGAAPFGSLLRATWTLDEALSTFTFSLSLHGKK